MKVEGENPVLVVETPGGCSTRNRKGRGYNFTSSKGRKFAERRKKERAVQGAPTLLDALYSWRQYLRRNVAQMNRVE